MTDTPFAAFLDAALKPAPATRQFASDIAVKPFQPIVTDWVDRLHDAVGGDE